MNAMTPICKSSLSDLDWNVVEMARADGPLSLNPEGLLAKFAWIVLGTRVPQGMANEQLEALRRFCVRAWYWDFVPARDVRPLIDAGYSSSDALQILEHVASCRGFTPSLLEVPA
jgi:hypothetical protein